MPFDQIKLIISSACFADSDTECVEVARMIYRLIGKKDIFPLISIHRGLELASRCLVCIGLFKKSMVERTKRKSYPTYEFYRRVGIKTLDSIEMEEISNHFDNWTLFIGEMLYI